MLLLLLMMMMMMMMITTNTDIDLELRAKVKFRSIPTHFLHYHYRHNYNCYCSNPTYAKECHIGAPIFHNVARMPHHTSSSTSIFSPVPSSPSLLSPGVATSTSNLLTPSTLIDTLNALVDPTTPLVYYLPVTVMQHVNGMPRAQLLPKNTKAALKRVKTNYGSYVRKKDLLFYFQLVHE